MNISDVPDFPPRVDMVSVAFGTTEYLPDYETLPEEYKAQNAKGCRVAEKIFYVGWVSAAKFAEDLYGPELELRSPPKDYCFSEGEETDPVKRFQSAVSAHLISWSPKHEHKIASVGYLIDLWLGQVSEVA